MFHASTFRAVVKIHKCTCCHGQIVQVFVELQSVVTAGVRADPGAVCCRKRSDSPGQLVRSTLTSAQSAQREERVLFTEQPGCNTLCVKDSHIDTVSACLFWLCWPINLRTLTNVLHIISWCSLKKVLNTLVAF